MNERSFLGIQHMDPFDQEKLVCKLEKKGAFFDAKCQKEKEKRRKLGQKLIQEREKLEEERQKFEEERQKVEKERAARLLLEEEINEMKRQTAESEADDPDLSRISVAEDLELDDNESDDLDGLLGGILKMHNRMTSA
jgi:hypothetical protein